MGKSGNSRQSKQDENNGNDHNKAKERARQKRSGERAEKIRESDLGTSERPSPGATKSKQMKTRHNDQTEQKLPVRRVLIKKDDHKRGANINAVPEQGESSSKADTLTGLEPKHSKGKQKATRVMQCSDVSQRKGEVPMTAGSDGDELLDYEDNVDQSFEQIMPIGDGINTIVEGNIDENEDENLSSDEEQEEVQDQAEEETMSFRSSIDNEIIFQARRPQPVPINIDAIREDPQFKNYVMQIVNETWSGEKAELERKLKKAEK